MTNTASAATDIAHHADLISAQHGVVYLLVVISPNGEYEIKSSSLKLGDATRKVGNLIKGILQAIMPR